MNDVTEKKPPQLLSYGRAPNRRRKRRHLAIFLVALSVPVFMIAADKLRRPLWSVQRIYYAWALPGVVADAREVAQSGSTDRDAMTALWRRMHEHRRRSLHLSQGWSFAPPDVAKVLFMVDRPSEMGTTPEGVTCVGLAEKGVNGLPYLFVETWSTPSSGAKPDVIARVQMHVAPSEVVRQIEFVTCRLDSVLADKVSLDFTIDGQRGRVHIPVTWQPTLNASGDGWFDFTDCWYPGPGALRFANAPAATWIVKVGERISEIALPDNDHVAIAPTRAFEPIVLPIRGAEGADPMLPRAWKPLGQKPPTHVLPPTDALRLIWQYGDPWLRSQIYRPDAMTADGRLAAAADQNIAIVWTNAIPGVAYRFDYSRLYTMTDPTIALSSDGATMAVISPEWKAAMVWNLRDLPGLFPAATSAPTIEHQSAPR